MKSFKEYLELADDCMQNAENAIANPAFENRAIIFAKMALAYLKLAEKVQPQRLDLL